MAVRLARPPRAATPTGLGIRCRAFSEKQLTLVAMPCATRISPRHSRRSWPAVAARTGTLVLPDHRGSGVAPDRSKQVTVPSCSCQGFRSGPGVQLDCPPVAFDAWLPQVVVVVDGLHRGLRNPGLVIQRGVRPADLLRGPFCLDIRRHHTVIPITRVLDLRYRTDSSLSATCFALCRWSWTAMVGGYGRAHVWSSAARRCDAAR